MSYDDLRRGRYSEQQRAYFVTAVLAEREQCYFADFSCARCVVAEMRTLHDDETVSSLAWVVMPDHVHWLFQLGERMDLSAAVKRFKACSARRVGQKYRRIPIMGCNLAVGADLSARNDCKRANEFAPTDRFA